MANDSASARGAANTPPRVLVVEPEQWPRALARGALREVGYDAVGAEDLQQALAQWGATPERGAVRVVVVDHDALRGADAESLRHFRAALGEPAMVLIRRPTRTLPAGEWTVVLTRPASLEELTATVERLHPLTPSQRRPLDREEE